MILLIVLIILILVVAASCVKIVPQAHAVILERLGAYQATWDVGIHFKIPFIERIAKKVNLKEQVVDFPPQPVITKDNVTMQIDTVVFFQITDPKLFSYGVERREAILIAEGEKHSTILVAEGKKQSAILDAEAEKQAAILRAEAQKERMIREAEGEAVAIQKVQQATADGLRMIREAGADEAVLTLKSLEAFEKAADGRATKIIIPSEIQGLAGLAASLKGIVEDEGAKTE